jgi:hypothetical protein
MASKDGKCRYKYVLCRCPFRIILLIKPNKINTLLEHFYTIILQLNSTFQLHHSSQLINMSFHPDNLPSLNGKVFIVTGGNAGM